MKKKNRKSADIPQPPRRLDLVMNIIANVGLVAIVISAAMPLLRGPLTVARYVYAIGAGLTLTGRLFVPYRGDSTRIRRLFSMQIFAALAFVVAAFFMFYSDSRPNDWIAFTIVGAVLQIYAAFMIEYLRGKEQNDAIDQKKPSDSQK